MYQNILIPITPDHEALLPEQIEIAQRLKAEGGKISAVSVVEDFPTHVAEYMVVRPDQKEITKRAFEMLDRLFADDPDIGRKVLTGKPGVVVAEYAEKTGADLIVACASRPGSSGYALGSTSSRLTRRATCSVMVVR
ncbi:universal stress protein [Cognatishimia sp. WU-CL00825]|uniref:universal stress protein n=1 Tax=Cognatishimia sp. WU-CL00825 TaxID=3127658 RepID=UPI003107440E